MVLSHYCTHLSFVCLVYALVDIVTHECAWNTPAKSQTELCCDQDVWRDVFLRVYGVSIAFGVVRVHVRVRLRASECSCFSDSNLHLVLYLLFELHRVNQW